MEKWDRSKMKLKYKLGGVGFCNWDDGHRVSLVCLKKWEFGWKVQQSGGYFFLGFCYLWFQVVFVKKLIKGV